MSTVGIWASVQALPDFRSSLVFVGKIGQHLVYSDYYSPLYTGIPETCFFYFKSILMILKNLNKLSNK